MNLTILSEEQIASVLAIEEGHLHDLKAIEIKPSKLTETVSAFANSSGGEIYVGIDEIDVAAKNRKWRGFPRIEDANAHIQEIDRLLPLGDHYRAEFLESSNDPGYVLLITVFKTKEIIRSSSRIPYVRKSAQKIPVTSDEALSRLRYDKGIESFENSTIVSPLEEVSNSEVIINFILNVIPSSEPEAWLRKQRLIHGNNPTVAGLVLFSDEPQALLPKRCAVKIYRYKTKGEGARDVLAFNPLTIEGSAYDVIKNAVSETKRLIEDIQKLGQDGLEAIAYPEETLHEITTNAVLHRDYSITTDIQIRIYDDRIEIESPGIFPGHITPENVLQEQFARNPQIVRIINKFPDPPNKDVGEGLNTAFEAMKNLRLKEPQIFQKDNSVLIVIRHSPLASPEETIMEYLTNNDEIVNRVARDLTGITSENSMKNVFKKLARKDMIEPVPGKTGFASAWRIKATDDQQGDGANENNPPQQNELFS